MKSYRQYKVDQLFSEELDLDRLAGPTSVLGTGTQRANPMVLTKLRSIMDDITDEFPDPSEALQEIITAATVLLGRTGRTMMNPKQMRAILAKSPDPATAGARELPGDEGEEL